MFLQLNHSELLCAFACSGTDCLPHFALPTIGAVSPTLLNFPLEPRVSMVPCNRTGADGAGNHSVQGGGGVVNKGTISDPLPQSFVGSS